MTLKKHAGPAPTCGLHIPAVCRAVFFISRRRASSPLHNIFKEPTHPSRCWPGAISRLQVDRRGRRPRKEKTTSRLPPLSIKASVGVAFSPNLRLIRPVSRPSRLFAVIHVLLASMLVKAHTGSLKRTRTPNNLLHSFQVLIPSEQSGLHQPCCDLSHFETFGQLYKESWRIQTHTLLCTWHVFLLSYYILLPNSGGLRAKQCFMSLELTTSCHTCFIGHPFGTSLFSACSYPLLVASSLCLSDFSPQPHVCPPRLPSAGLGQRSSKLKPCLYPCLSSRQM